MSSHTKNSVTDNNQSARTRGDNANQNSTFLNSIRECGQANRATSVTSLCIAGRWTALLLRKKILWCRGVPCLNRQLAQTWVTPSKKEADKQTSNVADKATPTTRYGPREKNEKLKEEGLPTSVGVALIVNNKGTKLSSKGYNQFNHNAKKIHSVQKPTVIDCSSQKQQHCLRSRRRVEPGGRGWMHALAKSYVKYLKLKKFSLTNAKTLKTPCHAKNSMLHYCQRINTGLKH